MKQVFFIFACFIITLIPNRLTGQPEVLLESFASGFSSPVGIVHAGDERLFVVERGGRIRVIDTSGNIQATPFLDIDDRVHNTGGQSEQGLLGLAFHPDFKNNGYFFVNYTDNNDDTRVSRFSVFPTDSTQADPNSELILLSIEQPFTNHNAGDLSFGPDGYLYIGTGDGGAANDPGNRAQNRLNLLGKMLRIDIDNGNPYAIPADNPFVNDAGTLDEIWALGLRNPWRHSFDRLTGDFWIADVGQGAFEEVNFQPASDTGGLNYGWRCYEANATFNTSGCGDISLYTPPVAAYSHNGFQHCSVTGGYVYRGVKYPPLYGYYLFADYCSGRFWATKPDGQGGWQTDIVADYPNAALSSFGEDVNGELYAASLGAGRIYRVTADLCSGIELNGTVTDVTCNGGSDGAIELDLTGNADDYTLTWLPAVDSLSAIPAGTYTVTYNDSNGCTVEEAFTVEEPSPEVITDNLITYAGDSLVVSEIMDYTFNWTLNGDLIPGATDRIYYPLTSGTYSMVFFDQNGCEVTLIQTVEVIISSTIGLTMVDQFRVRPSLFRESLIVDLETSQNLSLRIQLIDRSGKVLRETTARTNGPFQLIWNTADLAAGIYFVQLLGAEGTISEKVVKLE